jgi:hypothetical protein
LSPKVTNQLHDNKNAFSGLCSEVTKRYIVQSLVSVNAKEELNKMTNYITTISTGLIDMSFYLKPEDIAPAFS